MAANISDSMPTWSSWCGLVPSTICWRFLAVVLLWCSTDGGHIKSFDVVCLLRVLLTPNLLMDKHVTSLGAKCFFQLQQLHRIRRSLDDDFVTTLVHAFVTNRVEYCVILLAGLSKNLTGKEGSGEGAYFRGLFDAKFCFSVWVKQFSSTPEMHGLRYLLFIVTNSYTKVARNWMPKAKSRGGFWHLGWAMDPLSSTSAYDWWTVRPTMVSHLDMVVGLSAWRLERFLKFVGLDPTSCRSEFVRADTLHFTSAANIPVNLQLSHRFWFYSCWSMASQRFATL